MRNNPEIIQIVAYSKDFRNTESEEKNFKLFFLVSLNLW